MSSAWHKAIGSELCSTPSVGIGQVLQPIKDILALAFVLLLTDQAFI